MYTFNIEKYTEHYVPNAKSVLVKNFRHSLKEGITAIKSRWGINFELSFNYYGVLLTVTKFDRLGEKSTIYYNEKNKIIKIITTETGENVIKSESLIYYDDKSRISYEEHGYKFVFSQPMYLDTYTYKYDGNICIISMTKEYEEENYTITNITDNKGNSIEYKAENDIEILHWERYKYDLNNKLISTVYLDEAGNECSKDDEHKMKDIYSEKYIYNEKNDWIKEEIYKNNILIESTEREIIYY